MSPPSAAPLSLRRPLQRPQRQRGAYALVQDGGGRVLVVQAGNGRHYLPGGRIEPGESPVEALMREVGEECAWAAEVLGPLGEREQPIFGGDVTLSATYWRARLVRPLASEPECLSHWLAPAEAMQRLHRESERNLLRATLGRDVSAAGD